ncbi:hypothetical protein NLX83_39445 [Allokutzneria sp. A3M-2-11 16]|uniref:DUF2637 domain-containing protein n=1 Tax=Allokutzneria sp. A3M-2-11 16 TaxID=2962043 RepID=UPI0020B8B732|nr:DUF2637 domain-containing protein [Allokutzneria sp. A3M-2-11 16]MCP3805359.1 hypothetical protein [Allokutzneria sp. A3M-2-11 16]
MRSAPNGTDDPPTGVPRGASPHWSARLVAWTGFAFGSVASIAANVLSTWLPVPGPDGKPVARPEGWVPELAPQLGAPQLGAAVWSIALLVSVEVLTRVPWPNTALWIWARYLGTGSVALGSAVISYSHMRDVLLSWGYHWWAASVGPIVVDGLMTVSGFALLAMSRAADHVVVAVAGLDQAVQAGPAGPPERSVRRSSRLDRARRTGPVRERTVDRRTTRRTRDADRSADQVARGGGPAWTVAPLSEPEPARERGRSVHADRSTGPDLVVAPLDPPSGPVSVAPDQTTRRRTGPVRDQRTGPVRARTVDQRTTRPGPDGPDPAGGRNWTGDAPRPGPPTPRTGPGQAAPTGPTGPDRTERTTETRTGPRTSTGPGRTTRTTSVDDLHDVGARVLRDLQASGARVSRRPFAAAIRARGHSIGTVRAGDLLRELTERQRVTA